MNSKLQTEIPFSEALKFWFKLGFISFGGPAGQIAIMHKELVEEKRWISENRFLHALNYCMVLPGPEAQQLAIYIGWLLHRTWGGVVAGVLFVLPSLFILIGLSYIYVAFGHVSWIAAFLYGIKPAVAAIVVQAVHRIGSKTLKTPTAAPVLWTVAVMSFIAIYFLALPFPIIVICAALIGFFGAKLVPHQFSISAGHTAKKSMDSTHVAAVIDDERQRHLTLCLKNRAWQLSS
jgi:chromate transporter